MMSVVVKRLTDNRLMIYTKGADSSLLPRISEGIARGKNKLKMEQELSSFEKMGFRVLFFAKRFLTKTEAASLMV